MLTIYGLLVFIVFISLITNTIEDPFDTEDEKSLRFPCFLKGFGTGHCVPKLECCSGGSGAQSKWRYNQFNYGDCNYKQFCCTNDVLCQNCPEGTRDVNDTCSDINECEEPFGLCSGHRCINTFGSYICHCSVGYRMIGTKDRPKTCKHINQSESIDLLFSASLTINSIVLYKKPKTKAKNSTIDTTIRMIYSGTLTPKSIDYSLSGNYIAWTDEGLGQINIAPINDKLPSLVVDRVILRHIKDPISLSIDWIHNLLYWIDLDTRTINVVNILKPYDYYTVVNVTNQEPRDLVVNVLDSCLVWNHVGLKPRILRSLGDGSNQSVLFSHSKHTFCLTVDVFIKRYYFIDIEFSLYSVDFEGKEEKQIFVSKNLLNHINSMSVYYDEIFISTDSLIYKINKFGHFDKHLGERAEALVSSLTPNTNLGAIITEDTIESHRKQLLNVKIIDSILQPKVMDKCFYAKCSHICLPSDERQIFRCICPTNTILVNHSICAEKKFENFLYESMIWEKDLQKLIKHSISKSVYLRDLLNHSFAEQTDLSHLFAKSFEESEQMRKLFNITSKQWLEMKKTFIQSINETLVWKRLLNLTFNNDIHFQNLLNQSFYSNNLTEVLNFINNLTKDESHSSDHMNESRVGEQVILILILIGIIIIILIFLVIGYKFDLLDLKTTSNSSANNYRKPLYCRSHVGAMESKA